LSLIPSPAVIMLESDTMKTGTVRPKESKGLTKDQSYFLSFLSQTQLAQLILPLGEYTKTEVRETANRLGLHIAAKPDSQNFVCGDYTSLFKTESNTGPILDKLEIYWDSTKGYNFILSVNVKD